MKNFTCIFPGLYNYILTKDVGMIPYTLSKEYESKIITYDNEEYSYLDTILKSENFNIECLEKTDNEKKDIVKYIKSNAKKIDILQLYHLRYNILPSYIFYYKLYNPSGKVYLKLDANNEFIDFLIKRRGILPSIRRLYVKILFKFIDIISIETKRNYKLLMNSNLLSKDKLLYLPNGIQKTDKNVTNKEPVILYVGYVEKKNKSIDMLLNAVKDIDLREWKVVLVGEILDDMKEFIDNYFLENPHLKDKVIFKGYISDKNILSEEYAKSSIYCCSSRKESFGISTLEAAYHGNYIISTKVGGSPDILEQTGYGVLIEHDVEKLRKTIKKSINNWDSIKQDPVMIQKIVYDKFNWDYICKKIIEKIEYK